ncbi:tyrosine-type recombinase/integrase, partial [Methanosarcina mazei]
MILKPKEKTKLDLIIERCLESIGANDDDNIDTITEWFSVIGKDDKGAKERTKLTYIRTLVEFCKFIDKTPYEFIMECKYEKMNVPDIDDRKIKRYFIKYKNAISDNAPKTIQRKITTIKSFCQTRNIELPFNEKKTKLALPKDENKHIPTREEIKEALQFANIRNKAVILLQASSGLASADVRNITVRQVKEGLDEDNIITFDLRRQKTGVPYITFCSPEATAAILAYMEYRNRPPFANTKEKKDQYEKRRIRSDDDYLFINLKIYTEYLYQFDEKYRYITDQEIQHAYRLIERSCEKQAPKGTHSYIRSHNMRKFFANTIKNHGLDFITIETLLGHKVKGSLNNYTEVDIKLLKEQYMKVLPHLMILEDLETRTLDSYEYSYNQASIQISNIKSNAMMELYPYLYRIIEDSKEIKKKYDNIIKLKKMTDNEKAKKIIDNQYENIDQIMRDREWNEGELNHKKAEYQKQIDDCLLYTSDAADDL